MTLQSSGPISLNNVNVELGINGITTISLNQPSVRSLLGKPSGAISLFDAYGKSNAVAINITISANTQNYNIFANKGGSYVPGVSVINLTIAPGVVVGSSSTSLYALDTGTGWAAGDTINIINNGYITGMGGGGGGHIGSSFGPGGPALILRWPVTITNGSGYIYSGGGGGAPGAYVSGTTYSPVQYFYAGGGGAGNTVGVGGTSPPGFGPTADSGTLTNGGNSRGGSLGGALNTNGQSLSGGYLGGGGGGGGANGGDGNDYGPIIPGAGHGLAITQNGNAITWISGNTRVYGGTA